VTVAIGSVTNEFAENHLDCGLIPIGSQRTWVRVLKNRAAQLLLCCRRWSAGSSAFSAVYSAPSIRRRSTGQRQRQKARRDSHRRGASI